MKTEEKTVPVTKSVSVAMELKKFETPDQNICVALFDQGVTHNSVYVNGNRKVVFVFDGNDPIVIETVRRQGMDLPIPSSDLFRVLANNRKFLSIVRVMLSEHDKKKAQS
jgi:hypothetical protein